MKLFNTKQTKTKIILFSFVLLFLSFNSVNTIRRRADTTDSVTLTSKDGKTTQSYSGSIQEMYFNFTPDSSKTLDSALLFLSSDIKTSTNGFNQGTIQNGKEIVKVYGTSLGKIIGFSFDKNLNTLNISTKSFNYNIKVKETNKFNILKKNFVLNYLLKLKEISLYLVKVKEASKLKSDKPTQRELTKDINQLRTQVTTYQKNYDTINGNDADSMNKLLTELYTKYDLSTSSFIYKYMPLN